MIKAVCSVNILILFNLFLICSSYQPVKLGNCPLTVSVIAEDENFDGYANVYVNWKLIGTTDRRSRRLQVSLKPGEYIIWVGAEGYEPWQSKILLLGRGYKQNLLARLKRLQEKKTEEVAGTE